MRQAKRLPGLVVALACLLAAASAFAQTPALQIPPEAAASPTFDAGRATNAYLASVPPDKKARSDAYFEGGYQFVVTPINNSIIRTQEYKADMFGLNASRQPDGFANAALKLGEYRKLDPGPIEEVIFFDHPSGRTRIFSAMRWKAEHVSDSFRPR